MHRGVRNARLIDGTGATPVDDAAVRKAALRERGVTAGTGGRAGPPRPDEDGDLLGVQPPVVPRASGSATGCPVRSDS
ncbi:hypothetical protein GCM10010307_08340 [Streptomyces vastus]|uniref:Uncharacterized protein n=1 Tax=Streptomyces vastus TaxID=285451 RepID=A0ABN3QD27_9ACTN